jgi:hypothetical protein
MFDFTFARMIFREHALKRRLFPVNRSRLRVPVAAVALLVAALVAWPVRNAAKAQQESPITTGTLLRQMTDLERLTRFPEPFYRTVQFSSYDRRSDQPGGPGWYANSDGFGGEPIPNVQDVLEEPGEDGVGTYLLCDVDGPGALVRTWTANMNGTVRLYLDGAEEPLYEGPATRFFKRPFAPLVEESGLPDSVFGPFAQRDAAYFPMPFAESLRVEWTGKISDVHFYELQVRRYEERAEVETFAPEDLRTYRRAFREVARTLEDPSRFYEGPSGTERTFSQTIPAGEQRALFRVEGGPQAITQLMLRAEAEDRVQALRQSVLHAAFDGHRWAQVQSPVGDFFGAAPGLNPFDALPFTVGGDGRMTSRYVMPFADSARVWAKNRGDQPVTISGSARVAGYDWDEERSMHFYARWRSDGDMNARSPYDLPFVLADGRGVYVGTASYVFNPVTRPISFGNWWGEGDEKIFVDDDAQPSIFGTGTEDYYNYSWAAADIFQTAYAGQPRNDGPGTRGFITNHRWHVLDPIPFRERLRFYMEFFTNFPREDFSYARISYFYGRPGLIDDHVPIADADVRLPERPGWSPRPGLGAKGATFYQTETLVDPGRPNVRIEEDALYAGGRLFVWTPEQEGDTLQLPLRVPSDGRYRLVLTARRSPESGTFSARLDGRPVSLTYIGRVSSTVEQLSLYEPRRETLRNYRIGKVRRLEEGTRTLTLRYEGTGEGGGGEIGIDFVWVQKRSGT